MTEKLKSPLCKNIFGLLFSDSSMNFSNAKILHEISEHKASLFKQKHNNNDIIDEQVLEVEDFTVFRLKLCKILLFY